MKQDQAQHILGLTEPGAGDAGDLFIRDAWIQYLWGVVRSLSLEDERDRATLTDAIYTYGACVDPEMRGYLEGVAEGIFAEV